MKTRQPEKRKLSRKARKAISIAQKARWAKYHQNKYRSNPNSNPSDFALTHKGRIAVMSFLAERMKIYNSSMEAYVDGFIEGWEEAAKFLKKEL